MKRIFVLLVAMFMFLGISAEPLSTDDTKANKNQAIAIGVGFPIGGSLLGIEYERRLFDQFAFTAGAGLIGFGGGFNYHFDKTLDSSFVHIGVSDMIPGDSGIILGEASINGRFFGWLEASVGYAYIIKAGDKFKEDYEENYEESVPVGSLSFSLAFYTLM